MSAVQVIIDCHICEDIFFSIVINEDLHFLAGKQCQNSNRSVSSLVLESKERLGISFLTKKYCSTQLTSFLIDNPSNYRTESIRN